jgi:hypothetical protein
VQKTTNKKSVTRLELWTRETYDPPPMFNTYTCKKIQVKMFLKKFKILKPEPTCTSKGSIIMYTRNLTIITPRKTSCKATNEHVVKMSVKRRPSFIINFHPSSKK